MRKYLIVVDMQEDFIYGSLGTKEAQAIVPEVVNKVKHFEGTIIFTRDTHQDDYLETQEGRHLPVEHCVAGSPGWAFIEELERLRQEAGWADYAKGTFGSVDLALNLRNEHEILPIESVELVGVCTDICVVSNALLLKAYLPEVTICVDESCCAGVTPEKHRAAIETMKSCQIMIK